jgi:NADH dehydrogenase
MGDDGTVAGAGAAGGAAGRRPRVFIVGGGFAGVNCAKALAKADADVTIVDRRNYHLFQPLLYQVATAALSPADIAAPIRTIVRTQRNCRVVLAEVRWVDLERRRLLFDGGAVEYDRLVLACGATHSYFGHDDWAAIAPGLKTVEDATTIRKRILLAFESAEYEGSAERRRAALTFAIVGGGPTGVELAGAIKEIAAQSIPRDFRNIDTTTTRVILFQGGDRLLPQFPAELGERAKRDLESMGVEVRLDARVTAVTPEGVRIGGAPDGTGGEFIAVRNVLWAAGVQASPVGRTLGVPVDRSGRVIVGPDLSVPGHPEVMVAGDLALAKSADTGAEVPGVAQGGIQMGRFAGRVIAAELAGRSDPSRRPSFVYHDKGTMATIGRARAVAVIGGLKFAGVLAWLLWAAIHITFLIGFRDRVVVLLNWVWNWVVFSRDARLITGDAHLDIAEPRPGEVIVDAGAAPSPARGTALAGAGDGAHPGGGMSHSGMSPASAAEHATGGAAGGDPAAVGTPGGASVSRSGSA